MVTGGFMINKFKIYIFSAIALFTGSSFSASLCYRTAAKCTITAMHRTTMPAVALALESKKFFSDTPIPKEIQKKYLLRMEQREKKFFQDKLNINLGNKKACTHILDLAAVDDNSHLVSCARDAICDPIIPPKSMILEILTRNLFQKMILKTPLVGKLYYNQVINFIKIKTDKIKQLLEFELNNKNQYYKEIIRSIGKVTKKRVTIHPTNKSILSALNIEVSQIFTIIIESNHRIIYLEEFFNSFDDHDQSKELIMGIFMHEAAHIKNEDISVSAFIRNYCPDISDDYRSITEERADITSIVNQDTIKDAFSLIHFYETLSSTKPYEHRRNGFSDLKKDLYRSS